MIRGPEPGAASFTYVEEEYRPDFWWIRLELGFLS